MEEFSMKRVRRINLGEKEYNKFTRDADKSKNIGAEKSRGDLQFRSGVLFELSYISRNDLL